MAALRDTPAADASEGRYEGARAKTCRSAVLESDAEGAPGARVCIRLRPDDRLLLRERAAARGMPSATYVAILVRAHLRHLAPLPKEELLTLKRSVAELGAIGRSFNQLARISISRGSIAAPAREDLRALLKVCEALRDNTKALIKASARAWEVGHADGER
jgi:hypothetical protein